MQRNTVRLSLLALAGLAFSSVVELRQSDASTLHSAPISSGLQPRVILASSADVLPSQRPCYLSSQSGPTASRFTRPADSGSNPWGLAPAPAGTGLVTMRPGETCATAGNSDLGSRAAGATVE